ncbi:MAG: DUF2125 domain-containing protein [Pseudomonadota bacterium]
MPRFFLTASALALISSPVLADVTAEQVWDDWQAYAAASGYDITASVETSGGGLTLNDIKLAIDLGDGGAMNIDYGGYEVVMKNQSDGTVAIALSESNTMTFDINDPEDGPVSITLDIAQSNPSMTATGDPGAITYDYATEKLNLTLAGIETDGVILTDAVARFTADVSNFAYTTTSATGDMRSLQQNMSIDSVAYDMAFNAPDSDEAFSLKGQMNGLSLAGSGDLPLDGDGNDVNALLSDGLNFDGTFKTTGGDYTASFNGPDGGGTFNTTSSGGAELRIAMDASGLVYEIAQRALTVNALLTDLPIPLSFSMDEAQTAFQVPVQKSETPQDFAMQIKLGGFKMSDMLWGMFDAGGQLPRDAANINLDLTGKAKLLFDYLDPAQAAVLEQADAAPGELNALTLNAVEVDMVGAKLTGTGDFTFDNSDLVTFDGMPRPQGAMDLKLVGGNGLLDKLVTMGFVPQEQAMGARMMMGLFAVPGEGADTLNSRIEVNEEGQVLANGQRLR